MVDNFQFIFTFSTSFHPDFSISISYAFFLISFLFHSAFFMFGFIWLESLFRAFFGIGLPAYFKAEAETFAFCFIDRRIKSAILACRHSDYYLQICEGHLVCKSQMKFSRNAALEIYEVSSGNRVPDACPVNKYVYVNKMFLVGSSGSGMPVFLF